MVTGNAYTSMSPNIIVDVAYALGHHGVAVDAAPPPALPCREGAEALGLDGAGLDDSLADGGRRLAGLHLREQGALELCSLVTERTQEGHGLDLRRM